MIREDPRVVELITWYGDDRRVVGSGYLVAPRLVLTATHVTAPKGGSVERRQARPLGATQFVDAELAWSSRAGWDASLLTIPSGDVTAGIRMPVRWGRLRGTLPVACRAIGFPDAKARAGSQAGRQVRDPDSIQGRLHPVTAAKHPVADLHVDGSVPLATTTGESLWAGMSGAAVLRGPWLVGIVTGDPASFGPDRLTVTLVEPLLEESGFRETLVSQQAGPEVGWADAPAALVSAYRDPPNTVSGARLLQATYQVLPFAGREPELAELTNWCESGERVGARLLTGAAGQGKTRLASELCERMAADGWLAGLLDRSTPEDLQALAAWPGPLLVVVDYAQARVGDVLALLDQLALVQGPSRVLLLAREAGTWWDNLPFQASKLTEDTLAAAKYTRLAPLAADRLTRSEQFWSAGRSLARRLRRPLESVVEPDLSDPVYGSPLFVQLAALSAVDQGSPPQAGRVRDHLLAYTLRREDAKYWQPAAQTAAVGLDQTSRTRAVAVATLTAATTEELAVEALRRLPELADASQLAVHQVARWLHDLDPESSSWLPPLQPDLLGEALVNQVLAQVPGLPLRLLGEPMPSWTRRLLSVLDLGASRFSAIGSARDQVLADQLPALLEHAHNSPDPDLGRILALAVEHSGSHALARRIVGLLPDRSLALAELATVAIQVAVQDAARQLLQAQTARQDPTPLRADHAGLLNDLAIRLGDLGRHEEALAAIEEAVELRRALAAARPDAYLPDLATSLNNLANLLGTLGRHEEALAAIEEAVELRRALAAARPDAYLPDLATSLNNLRPGDGAEQPRQPAGRSRPSREGAGRRSGSNQPNLVSAGSPALCSSRPWGSTPSDLSQPVPSRAAGARSTIG